jgi:hypothetical protein
MVASATCQLTRSGATPSASSARASRRKPARSPCQASRMLRCVLSGDRSMEEGIMRPYSKPRAAGLLGCWAAGLLAAGCWLLAAGCCEAGLLGRRGPPGYRAARSPASRSNQPLPEPAGNRRPARSARGTAVMTKSLIRMTGSRPVGHPDSAHFAAFTAALAGQILGRTATQPTSHSTEQRALNLRGPRHQDSRRDHAALSVHPDLTRKTIPCNCRRA